MQDNDPKYCSRHAQQFFQENNVHWWPTPPESTDLNPIENMWRELKEYLRAKVKPKHQSELINATVDQAKCRKYIGHLRKVIPRVIGGY